MQAPFVITIYSCTLRQNSCLSIYILTNNISIHQSSSSPRIKSFVLLRMSSMSNMHVISANSCVYRDLESKATQLGSLSCIRNQTSSAYQGLRSLKNLGKNQTRVSLRTSSVRKYSYARKSSSSAVVCESETEMRVVFVGTEVAPWSKTGGLGEVLGSLPSALAVITKTVHASIIINSVNLYSEFKILKARGHRVMTVTPRYDQYSDAWDTSVVVEVYIYYC